MPLESIPGPDGTVVDFFDPNQPPTSSPVTPQPSSSAARDQQVEEEQPEVVDAAVLSEGATAAEQLETTVQSTTTAATTTVSPQKEDSTVFDLCDIEIRIFLQRIDGNPAGRLVSVLIHNFSGLCVTEDFREVDLTDKARLDSIQRAIYPPMQRFLLKQAEAKQRKLEDEAKRTSRTVPPAAKQTTTPATASTAPATQPAAPPAAPPQARPASTAQTTATGKKEEATSGKPGKYQTIPLF